MNTATSLQLAMLANAMLYGMHDSALRLKNGVQRMHQPWEEIQLSKEQRKGKSFEEIQKLREEIYSAKVLSLIGKTVDSKSSEGSSNLPGPEAETSDGRASSV